MKIATNNDYTEAIIDDDCDFDRFYLIANLLQTKFNLSFTEKATGLETAYWDFVYKDVELTLHYTIWLGVTIFPKALKSATKTDNTAAFEIGNSMFNTLADLNWSEHTPNKISKKGSEGGIIILDFENSNGARITLEKECGNIPFAITMGIYGIMMHTHFEADYDEAMAYIIDSKYKINKILELYGNESSQEKYNKLRDELCEITRNVPDLSKKNSNPRHSNHITRWLKGFWKN